VVGDEHQTLGGAIPCPIEKDTIGRIDLGDEFHGAEHDLKRYAASC
jgi:hypothetical protein